MTSEKHSIINHEHQIELGQRHGFKFAFASFALTELYVADIVFQQKRMSSQTMLPFPTASFLLLLTMDQNCPAVKPPSRGRRCARVTGLSVCCEFPGGQSRQCGQEAAPNPHSQGPRDSLSLVALPSLSGMAGGLLRGGTHLQPLEDTLEQSTRRMKTQFYYQIGNKTKEG